MSKGQSVVFLVLAGFMVLAAVMLGNWAERINPEGIAPHPVADGNAVAQQDAPRNAFSFGASIGLLACSLVYCCVALGLVINARSRRHDVSRFTYWLGGLAATGFVLSYLVDDYFY